MAVQADAKDINLKNPDVARRNPSLKVVGGTQAAKAAPKKRRTAEQIRTDRAKAAAAEAKAKRESLYTQRVESRHVKENTKPINAGGASPRTRRAAQLTQQTHRRIATSAPVRTARGSSVGGLLVLLTGAGVGFALLKNPALITAPFRFLGTLFARFSQVFGAGMATATGGVSAARKVA